MSVNVMVNELYIIYIIQSDYGVYTIYISHVTKFLLVHIKYV